MDETRTAKNVFERHPGILSRWERRGRLRPLPWFVPALCLGVTLLTWNMAVMTTEKALADYFSLRSREVFNGIDRRLQAYEQVLLGLKGLHESSDKVSRSEFREYVSALRLADNYPGIQGIGFTILIPATKKEQHETAIRSEGFPEYQIRPIGERDPYSSIIYLEPFADRNLRAFGYDMYSEPVRRKAMEYARDNDETGMSGKVRLVQESGKKEQAGFLMYVPIYRKFAPHNSLESRRAHIRGWSYAPFRMNDFMNGIQGERADDLDIAIFDGSEISREGLMYDSRNLDGDGDPGIQHPAAIQASHTLKMGGHSWIIRTAARQGLVDQVGVNRPVYVLIIGLITTALLSALTWLLVTGRERAISAAQEMNRDLQASELKSRLQSQRLEEVIWGTSIGTWEWNVQTGETVFNQHWAEIIGYSPQEIEPTSIETWTKFAHPDDLKRSSELLQRCFDRKAEAYECEVRMRHKNGDWVWVLDRGRVVEWTREGKPLRMSGTHMDITGRKQAENQLELAASVFTHAHEGIVITDIEGTIIDVNDTFTRITGYSREEALGKNPRILKSGRHDDTFYEDMWKALLGKGNWSHEIWNRRKNGEIYPVLLTISAVRDADGNTRNYVALHADISQQKQNELQLIQIAHHDGLTDLPNRALLTDRLQQAMAQSQRRKRSLAVAYIDLDGFKGINDRHGHAVGDQLLTEVSQRMKSATRAVDTVARIGGDEFVALLVDLEQPQDCEPVLIRLLEAASAPVTLGDAVLQVSASIGVTVYPLDASDADHLLRHADHAMYQAKNAGKNCYRMFSQTQSAELA